MTKWQEKVTEERMVVERDGLKAEWEGTEHLIAGIQEEKENRIFYISIRG